MTTSHNDEDKMVLFQVYLEQELKESFYRTLATFGESRIQRIYQGSRTYDLIQITLYLTEAEILILRIRFTEDQLSIYKVFQPDSDMKKHTGYAGEHHE